GLLARTPCRIFDHAFQPKEEDVLSLQSDRTRGQRCWEVELSASNDQLGFSINQYWHSQDYLSRMAIVEGAPAPVKVQLWDTAGQEKFGAARLPSSFFRHADAALVVYDVTNRQSFIGVLRWVLQLQTYRSAAAADSDFSIVLVGHKCDVSNATRQAHENEGRDFAKIIAAFHFFERSSKDGTNVLMPSLRL
ncbi:hypothetical protein JG688_00003932, partial [Phytophthora aleatoria]